MGSGAQGKVVFLDSENLNFSESGGSVDLHGPTTYKGHGPAFGLTTIDLPPISNYYDGSLPLVSFLYCSAVQASLYVNDKAARCQSKSKSKQLPCVESGQAFTTKNHAMLESKTKKQLSREWTKGGKTYLIRLLLAIEGPFPC
jgi:hypothetical protein